MSAADPDAPGACAPLPVVRAADLPTRCRGEQWLVEPLWAAEGAGIIGGTPKSCKTWLALELAVAVASGSDALGRFPVASPGPVLAYGAEDGPAQLRERLLAITRARTLELADLDLFLLSTPSLRLDSTLDRARLNATIERMRPRLLLLDPFVRLHRADENSAADMAALLSELRALQRRHRLAIMVVHHLRKNAAASLGGQALRGSGDLHAWGDSNLYLRRREDHLTLSVEHRAAPAPAPFRLILAEQPTPHLDVVDDDGTAPDPAAPTSSPLASTSCSAAQTGRSPATPSAPRFRCAMPPSGTHWRGYAPSNSSNAGPMASPPPTNDLCPFPFPLLHCKRNGTPAPKARRPDRKLPKTVSLPRALGARPENRAFW
ncbi:MAG: AAA family ATPase [Candidatus Binatia bacterium]